ncbi:hypothetical protein GO986_11950 [Deinococcus sp. HMF7620]|uniref:DUF6504 domain-containing protein n=1 Tax=Deinococcus arboris TaxID=2682977 RepID=A0A7C9LRL9_9DEIO|nr:MULTISPECIES: DUF6504 family protein [Deinococcus]MBZ9752167.1 DUF6504 family protein [Deinococcus betulae]MVN87481.1 hypothetical protein [Deinococcus arboris]
MKAVQQEVTVVSSETGMPVQLTWQGRPYRVQAVLDRWRAGGRWWLGEQPRACFLVQAGTLTLELHQEAASPGRWWLARLQD